MCAPPGNAFNLVLGANERSQARTEIQEHLQKLEAKITKRLAECVAPAAPKRTSIMLFTFFGILRSRPRPRDTHPFAACAQPPRTNAPGCERRAPQLLTVARLCCAVCPCDHVVAVAVCVGGGGLSTGRKLDHSTLLTSIKGQEEALVACQHQIVCLESELAKETACAAEDQAHLESYVDRMKDAAAHSKKSKLHPLLRESAAGTEGHR